MQEQNKSITQRLRQRVSGILMHPSSFPGMWGMGDLGSGAYRFIDFLADGGQKLWQTLPLVIPDTFGSPYASVSAFAGNGQLISPEKMCSEGLINGDDIEKVQEAHSDGPARKLALIHLAFEKRSSDIDDEFLTFQETNQAWLRPYAVFRTLEKSYGAPWTSWPKKFKTPDDAQLAELAETQKSDIQLLEWEQFLFYRQWQSLRRYAHSNDIAIIGDIPIFVSHHSVDVWQNQSLFKLNTAGKPKVVAGVPPDMFSKTGQRWGNPHYDWEKMEASGFSWWVQRLAHLLELVDFIRLDHFRGFEAAWEVPAKEKTAIKGKWVPGPGEKLFDRIEAELGQLPIIAEDLGLITPEVKALKEKYGFPGMKILQFAFNSDDRNEFLPHNFEDENCVIYTGTHDNNTTLGWYHHAGETELENLSRYLWIEDEQEMVWDFIKMAMESLAIWTLIPMQDILGLDERSRMNFPGTSNGNWQWQMKDMEISHEITKQLKKLTQKSNRL
jgi:4-alpha-glucanotransferase